MIHRERQLRRVEGLLGRHPVVAILGARQVGKTTLAREIEGRFDGPVTHLDLENPSHQARLEDPLLAFQGLEGLVVLDEIQRQPEIFPVLRVLVDRPESSVRFLILGSAAPDLLRQSSESLAGRIAYLRLDGFQIDEVGVENLSRLWVRGGFPRSFLAESSAASSEWRLEFIRTFVERDLPQLGVAFPAETIRRFWQMLAHAHGEIWNASAFARSFGVSDSTVRRYLDALSSTFVVRQLQPWHENLRKRQVKAPKVFLSDSGLLHSLLNLQELDDLAGHPKLGASWEGFGIQTVLARLGVRPEEAFFWATHAGAEVDLVVVRGRRRLGFEFKRTVAPRTTRSMHIAIEDLGLEGLDVIHAGQETFPLTPRIRALALADVWRKIEPFPKP
jgi:uncharacterized protein